MMGSPQHNNGTDTVPQIVDGRTVVLQTWGDHNRWSDDDEGPAEAEEE